MKYLGVILDSKLNYNVHIKEVIRKAYVSLWTCKSLIGKKWRLRPKMMRWAYEAIVRPVITYASIVWWEKTKQSTKQTLLTKFQRLACILILRPFKTTPTIAMEVLLNLPPLYLFIQYEARNQNYKFKIHDQIQINKLCDHTLLKGYEDQINVLAPTDHLTTLYNFDFPFKIIINERLEWTNNEVKFPNDAILFYTDGSKTLNGTGSGIFSQQDNTKQYASLGKYATITQAEIHAIELCALNILKKELKHKNIFILTDSQASLKAFSSNIINSKLVLNCVKLLKEVSNNNTITLTWVPGHSDIHGNEEADKLAKKGADEDFIGPEPFCGISLKTFKLENKKWLSDQANQFWQTSK